MVVTDNDNIELVLRTYFLLCTLIQSVNALVNVIFTKLSEVSTMIIISILKMGNLRHREYKAGIKHDLYPTETWQL